MTIRLLCPFDRYPTNAIVTLDAGTEAGLIAGNMATSNLTGGTAWVEPVAEPSAFPGLVAEISAGLVAAPTAAMLSIESRLDTFIGPDGTRYRSNATSTAAGTALVVVGEGTGGGGGFTVLDAGMSQIDVTCTAANTNYQAYTLPLNAANAPAESIIEVFFQVHWAGLAATTKTMLLGIGRNFATAMTGTASNADGAIVLSRTNASANNTSDFRLRITIGINRDVQTFQMASNGDENTGTGSIQPVGAVTLSADDCHLYIGLKSATAGEVLRLSSRTVTRITVPA